MKGSKLRKVASSPKPADCSGKWQMHSPQRRDGEPWLLRSLASEIWGSVQFSLSVVSDSLRPHGLQHTKLPCSSLTPEAYSNSCPSSWWCHTIISSSVIPFSSHLQSFPASVQFSLSVMSDSLQPHELQHARPPYPSPTPRVHPNPCPLSQWCHPTISSSVVPFSSCPQSFPASGSFQMSQFFTSGGQNIGVSASASVLPMSIQDWFPLGWTGWISLQSKGLLRVFSNTTVQKHQFFGAQLSLWSNSRIHTWLLEKP